MATLVLDNTRSIQAVLTTSPATNPTYYTSWAEITQSELIETPSDGILNGTTPVTIIAAPVNSNRRVIRDIRIHNQHSAIVTLQINLISGANTRKLYGVLLDPGDTFTLDGVFDNVGNLKQTGSNGGGGGSAIAVSDEGNQITSAATSFNFTGTGVNATNSSGNVTVNVSGREQLTANQTYYVRTDGNDNNNGLANNSGSAFLTIQKAINTVANLDLNGYNITITVNTGIYNISSSLTLKDPIGSGKVTINTTGGTVTVQSTSNTNSFNRGLIECLGSVKYIINGFKLIHQYLSQSSAWNVSLYVSSSGKLKIQGVEFGGLYSTAAAFSKHILVDANGYLEIDGNYTISGATGASNNNANHINCRSGGIVDHLAGSTTVTITNTPTFLIFVGAESTGLIQAWTVTYSGSIASGCKQYSADTNGVVKTWGSTTFPGSVSGTTSSGGQKD